MNGQKLDGREVAHATVEQTVPTAFSATETLDVGRAFPFSGTINSVTVTLGA